MTEKRFKYTFEGIEDTLEPYEEYKYTLCNKDGFQDLCDMLNELNEENEQLKQDIKNLKITIEARETLIDVCEKKFKELGYIITVDDDGYVIVGDLE